MKAKHFVTLFFIVGLVFAVAAMVNLPVGSVYADSSDGGNAAEKLIGNPPEILKSLCPDTLKAVIDAAAAGNMKVSAPDGPAPTAAGNKDVCVSISSAAFYAVPTSGALGCNTWFLGMFATKDYCSIMTGINLPDGAEVYKVEMTAIDNNASIDQGLVLFRLKDDLTFEQVAQISTSGQSSDIRQFSTEAITFPTVVLSDYSYFLFSSLHLDTVLISVRVWYHPHTDATFKSIEIAD
jgi:hypothetical protein